jgi:hypothetical protein
MAIVLVFETHATTGARLEDLAAQDFAWQEGWEYRVG